MVLEEGSTFQPPGGSKWAGVAGVVAYNAIPIFGVLFWGWSAFALIFLYWLENVAIGARTLASMLACGVASANPISLVGAVALGAFFTFHYGMFCTVHGIFVVSMFGSELGENPFGPLELLHVAQKLFAAHSNIAVGFAAIAIWQAIQFLMFLIGGEVRRTDATTLMGAPYPRIIVLHMTIIFGGMVVFALNQPIFGVLLLAAIKTSFDVAEVLGHAPKFGIGRRAVRKLPQSGTDQPPS